MNIFKDKKNIYIIAFGIAAVLLLLISFWAIFHFCFRLNKSNYAITDKGEQHKIHKLPAKKHSKYRKNIDKSKKESHRSADHEDLNIDDLKDYESGDELVIVTENIKEKLKDILMKPAKSIPVNKDSVREIRNRFHSFISPSIDLSKAEKRKNERLNRTSYFQEFEHGDIPRTLFEEMTSEGDSFGLSFTLGEVDKPKKGERVKVHYHEGQIYFDFEREKEEIENLYPFSEEEATETVLKYVKNIGLINETLNDRIRNIDFENSNISADLNTVNGEGRDYVAKQSVNLRRSYEGIPVINSSVRVSFTPANSEVIQVAQRFWVPLAEEKETTIKENSSAEVAEVMALDVEKMLEDVIMEHRDNFKNAVIKDIHQAYFQTTEKLKPILYCDVEYNYPFLDENGKAFTKPGVVLIDPFINNTKKL